MMKTILLTLLVATACLLHQDFWNWNKTEPLLFDFMPIGLAYHAAYSFAAAALMWVFVKFAWPAHLETVEPYRDDNETNGHLFLRRRHHRTRALWLV